jgi:hypothetical protein
MVGDTLFSLSLFLLSLSLFLFSLLSLGHSQWCPASKRGGRGGGGGGTEGYRSKR